MRTRRCLGPAAPLHRPLISPSYMAPDQAGCDTLGNPDFIPTDCVVTALPQPAFIKSMLKKDRAPVELRYLQCTMKPSNELLYSRALP